MSAIQAFDAVKKFSYDLIVNQSPLTSLKLVAAAAVAMPVICYTSESQSLFGRTTYYSSLIVGAISCNTFGAANSIRIYRAFEASNLSELAAEFLSRNISPTVSEKISEYGFGTALALSLPLSFYGFKNKSKWRYIPPLACSLLITFKVCQKLLEK